MIIMILDKINVAGYIKYYFEFYDIFFFLSSNIAMSIIICAQAQPAWHKIRVRTPGIESITVLTYKSVSQRITSYSISQN